MNHYELLYIVAGKFAEPEVKAVSDSVDALIQKVGGTITFTQYWERRKLAYPINHMVYGHYIITEFDSKPSAIIELDRQLRLTLSDVIRHQVVRKDKVGSPLSLPRTQVATQDTPQEETTPAAEEVVVTTETPAKKPAAKRAPKTAKAEEVASTTEEAPTPAVTASEEAAPEETSKKKKADKVSFEDLDKKLDEILNDLP